MPSKFTSKNSLNPRFLKTRNNFASSPADKIREKPIDKEISRKMKRMNSQAIDSEIQIAILIWGSTWRLCMPRRKNIDMRKDNLSL